MCSTGSNLKRAYSTNDKRKREEASKVQTPQRREAENRTEFRLAEEESKEPDAGVTDGAEDHTSIRDMDEQQEPQEEESSKQRLRHARPCHRRSGRVVDRALLVPCARFLVPCGRALTRLASWLPSHRLKKAAGLTSGGVGGTSARLRPRTG